MGTAEQPVLAYLTGEYPRTSDTFIQREVAALRADGFEVHTFSVRRPGSEHLVGPEQQEGQATTTYLLERARSSRLIVAHLRALVGRPVAYIGGLRLAWRTKRPGLRGTVYQLIYFVEAVLLADEIRRRGVDHLHNHFGDSSCTVAMLAAEVGRLPFSFTLHGSAIFFEAHTWRLGDKLDRAAFCACISHFTRSQAAIFASPGTIDRLHLIHCGVEPARLRPVSHEGTASRLLFVGRVVEAKGLAVLFEAIDRLSATHPKLTLTVVGEGPDRHRLARRAERMGLGDRVEFVGAKSQAEVVEHLAGSEIFVLPSYAEGVPVVVMEALGAGIPVVASLVGGMAEVVEDGVNGYLVRPGDADQLVDRLRLLLDDADRRAAFGRAGQGKVAAEFDSAVEARRLGSLFVNAARGLPSPIRPPRLG